MTEMNFEDINLIEIPVTLGAKKYLLKEGSADAVVKYRNAINKSTRFMDGKVTGVDGMSDAEPLLVSLCLFELYEQGGETRQRPTLLTEVLKLPNRITSQLFDKAKEITPNLMPKGKKTLEELEKDLVALQKEIEDAKAGKVEEDTTSKN